MISSIPQPFTVEPSVRASEQILLHCDGLDTICELYLNDVLLGYADNQHRTWEFDVQDLLKDGENILKIIFYSPTRYIKEEQKKIIVDGSSHAMVGFPHIRKAHCMFGWDWGPRLPDAGIWRDIELLGINEARIDSVYITQNHADGKVDLELEVEADVLCEECGISYDVTLTAP